MKNLTITLMILSVLVLNNTYALSEEECRQLYPCDCPSLAAEEEQEPKELINGINLDDLIKEENISLITIFVDRKNNITVLYKAEESISNIEEVKKIQEENIEEINIEKAIKTEKAWRTKNQSLAQEAYAIEELNRDYTKIRYIQNNPETISIWEKIKELFI